MLIICLLPTTTTHDYLLLLTTICFYLLPPSTIYYYLVGVWPQGCTWGLPLAPEGTLYPVEDMDVMMEYQRRPASPRRLKGSPLWAAGRHGVQDARAARVPRGPGRRPRPAACAQRCCVKWRASCQHLPALRYTVLAMALAFFFPVR